MNYRKMTKITERKGLFSLCVGTSIHNAIDTRMCYPISKGDLINIIKEEVLKNV